MEKESLFKHANQAILYLGIVQWTSARLVVAGGQKSDSAVSSITITLRTVEVMDTSNQQWPIYPDQCFMPQLQSAMTV